MKKQSDQTLSCVTKHGNEKVQKKERRKKLTSVSFMYVLVAGNVIFYFFPFSPQ